MSLSRLTVSALLVTSLGACSPPGDPTTDAGRDVDSDSGTDDDAGTGDAGIDARDTGPVPIVDPMAWTAADATDDPFADRPDTVDCRAEDGWGVEELDGTATLGVNTGACDYLTATQPLGRALDSGSDVTIQLWHFELQGDGEAHLAVQIGDEHLWETRIPIPAESELLNETVSTTAAHDEGEPVYFHVHNHGINSYNLVRLSSP